MDLISPELGLIIWQLIAFAILFFILAKFAWKPILSALDERDSTIEASLNEAEKARLEMQNLVADNERLLQEARVERDEILRSANEFATQTMEISKEEAAKAGAKMIEEAKAVIETEKQAALTDVKIQVAELSLKIAEKLMRQNLATEASQKELVEEFVKDIKLN
ncbi:MAG: F0F1 ATP synthase subunit B [Cytophagales bacterium]|uniref:F0F1 ATP synthase subunit B n=1 Tax=Cyclobacterium marinum TaxID=104 RepID=UPI0011ED57E5|nr:F0F1 ATP synthase subunit B [Cyclobacterium marinum]MBI0401617.1 F0F1 ATP synthase subunit B [Cyclobacterium marinum]MBR9773800.1 F0F1 ATP synthase subunit B [Cytophagales bacterium]|tara:strand:+ start:67740 stop:68234 length:495 start_codon:yes stop_codon:yes gene_type:complete